MSIKLKTINDILQVATTENYDRLTADILVTIYNLIKVKESLTEQEQKQFKIKHISWIDDNECRSGYKFNDKEVIWLNENNKD